MFEKRDVYLTEELEVISHGGVIKSYSSGKN
jgi:hypothetical protein